MGSRGRSIRLRIYFLVAIPLITMLGLFGYVAYTSTTTYLNLDRAPNLINATAEPLTNFVNLLQNERRAAVVYASHPSSANLDAFRSAISTTETGEQQVTAALNSVGTKSSESTAEMNGIASMTSALGSLPQLRDAITAKKIPALNAFVDYTNVIAGQGAVLQAEANSISDAAGVEQGLGLISAVNTQEDMSEQDAILAGALVGGSLSSADRVAFSDAVGRQQDDTILYGELFTPSELATYNATLNSLAPSSVQKNATAIQQAVQAGTPLSEIKATGLNSEAWQAVTKTWLNAASKAGNETAKTVLAANSAPAVDAKRRLWAISIVGAVGFLLTLLVTILLGRSINRRLTVLRTSALTLAREQLPAVVARLRRGESVDVAAEAPPVHEGNDEIGQVGQAIDAVRQTAIRSAIDEARVRQGVNDMFRNLARRNQSLLQRQLSVLDDMERRATDPDVLEDLFKMDHLTTRMRRHAEGLIILSGAPPGRSWSAPVKLIDVMRGAVAEVEDYARVTASTQSRAALSGSAVTDVIHLLAELIENATTLSPPFTQVRVGGESVANGFAIEIEDRGLGLSPQRLAELNDRLANPPDINPANTEQLGLFVVGQLARRHGINVTLRPSPYGGTTAVALIPRTLIVEEGPAALPAGSVGAPGVRPAGIGGGFQAPGRGAPGVEAAGLGVSGLGVSGTGAGGGAWAGTGSRAGAFAGANGPSAQSVTGSVSIPATPAAGNDWLGANGWPATAGTPATPAGPATAGNGLPSRAASGGAFAAPSTDDVATTGIRISGVLRQPGGGPGSFAPGSGPAPFAPGNGAEAGGRRGRHGTDDVPVVTGVPVGRPGPAPAAPFDVFTPVHRPDQDAPAPVDGGYQQSYPDFDSPAPDAAYDGGGGNVYDDSYQGDGFGTSFGNNGPGNGSYPNGASDGGSDLTGLPRRVRQASLAPELRASAGPADGSSGVAPASAASLSDMRNTLSAMQRGWQQGRSQMQPQTEDGRPDGE
ncbi:MAG TPA: nitrate- and nitrite sensing domain-containing protein [Trebonia sp.]|jgi:signal transduction histidine kinase|nr:nitrate- and nitrite sensing domain-containing protein [Trebonia sp.]